MRQAGRQAVVLRAGNALSLSFLYIRNSPILSRAREYMREGKAPKKGMLLSLLPHPRRRRRLYTLLSSYSPFCAPRTTRRRAVIILLSRVYTLLPSVPLSLSLSLSLSLFLSLSLLVYSDAAGAYSRVAVRNFACGLSSLSLSLSLSLTDAQLFSGTIELRNSTRCHGRLGMSASGERAVRYFPRSCCLDCTRACWCSLWKWRCFGEKVWNK